MQVELTYSDGISTYARSFDVYGVRYEDVELKTKLHKTLKGGYSQDSLGYRYEMEIDFMPLLGDRQSLFFLYGFCFGQFRAVDFPNPDIFGGVESRTVTLLGTDLNFQYQDKTKFADGFTMKFSENTLRTISDTGATRILRPTYVPCSPLISGDTMTIYINLVDDASAELVKKDFTFAGTGNNDDIAWGYLHRYKLDFGPVAGVTNREWLRDYCLWDNKQIDTTLIDPDNGIVTDVVCGDKSIKWQFLRGTKDALATSIMFLEKTARTRTQTYIPPVVPAAPVYDEVISDEAVFG